VSTKIEKEWQMLIPTFEARKKIEDIKEIVDLSKYYDELLKEAEED
tara:strand:+ start:330 stop:467 length:138 start_codon:yes stop_codon:yes gene_type:complete